MASTPRSIDVHAHVVLDDVMGAAGEHGPELGADECGVPWFRVGGYRLEGVRYRGSPFMDVELRLEAMDRAGIDFQVLSPNPLTYFHHITPADALTFCQRHNDALAELVGQHPSRLAGFAALPMQAPELAARELARATGELGLVGAYIGTEFGHELDAPGLDPFYAAVVECDVPLFMHPAPAGIDGPPGDARLRRFDLDLILGFAAEECLAVATLVFGGVLDRHPDLDLCLSHGGGGAPFMQGRMACAARKRPWSPERLRAPGAFEAEMARIWFDVHVHDPRSLALLADVVGTERLVWGTNFAGWDQGASDDLGDLATTLTANAERLLRLR
jgi:aminocarboxymuconate-semialdehyde decarboxylase